MSNEKYIEELLYEIYKQGKSTELFEIVDSLKIKNPKTPIFSLIEEAYSIINK